MARPLLLDLFCGAGGAGEGYARAGFRVVGVDLDPKPLRHNPHECYQGDALAVLDTLLAGETWQGYRLGDFAAIHASPPCGDFCALREFTTAGKHLRLIVPVYERLVAVGLPFIVENSDRAPMPGAIVLCGSMFGLNVLRHRAFWSNVFLWKPGPCRHTGHELVFSRTPRETLYRAALGVDWMPARIARQAIPPAYTAWLGRQLRAISRAERSV